jgi:hypothetical protein
MSQNLVKQKAEQQANRPVNFSDGNHALHLQVFLEWLPADLHDAPGIDWSRLPGRIMSYLVKTVGNSPFASCMALAAAAEFGPGDEHTRLNQVQRLYRLLLYAQGVCGIQSPAELTKDIWKSIVIAQGASSRLYNLFKAYHALTENSLVGYVEQLTTRQRAQIEYALLPRLPYRFVQQYFSDAALRDGQEQRRKSKSDILVPLHTLLIALVRFRKQESWRLFQTFQAAKEQVQSGEAQLPLLFSYEEELITVNQNVATVAEVRLEKRPVTLQFRLWDFRQWVIGHADDYDPKYVRNARGWREEFVPDKREFFVEFLGSEEDLLWFGEVVKYGLFQANTPCAISPENVQRRKELLENLGISYGLSCTRDGLLTPHLGFTYRLAVAMARTEAILFDPESLYRGALYAAALATLALTNGSRMTELLQVSADRFKERSYRMHKDGNSSKEERIMRLQWLLPKGKRTEEQRKLFLISDGAYQFLAEIAQELRKAHNDRIPAVRIHPDNKKAGDLPTERYLFQWAASADGQWGALHSGDVQALLRFILYGLEFRTKQGEPFSVTTHLLRHVTATAARHEHEVPPAAVARALHHETRPGGAIPESTEYYSREPEAEERALVDLAEFQINVEEHAVSILIHWPDEQERQSMDEELQESFERWHTLLETTLGFCGNVDLCPRGYNRTLCIGCPHLVPDPRKLKVAQYWRAAYAKLAEELEAQGNDVDERQYRLLVRDLDTHINEMQITQASIEDGTRKPTFLQLASAPYDAVVIDAEA